MRPNHSSAVTREVCRSHTRYELKTVSHWEESSPAAPPSSQPFADLCTRSQLRLCVGLCVSLLSSVAFCTACVFSPPLFCIYSLRLTEPMDPICDVNTGNHCKCEPAFLIHLYTRTYSYTSTVQVTVLHTPTHDCVL